MNLGIAASSVFTDSRNLIYKTIPFILFTNVAVRDDTQKMAEGASNEESCDLVEHHLGVLLESDLPDINSLKYLINDRSDDFSDILNALDHLVEIHSVNLT